MTCTGRKEVGWRTRQTRVALGVGLLALPKGCRSVLKYSVTTPRLAPRHVHVALRERRPQLLRLAGLQLPVARDVHGAEGGRLAHQMDRDTTLALGDLGQDAARGARLGIGRGGRRRQQGARDVPQPPHNDCALNLAYLPQCDLGLAGDADIQYMYI